jgi:putative aldouronate transport system substrate-binding protein
MILVLVFLLAFFAGCGTPNAKNSGNTPTNNSGANNSGNSNAAETEEPVPSEEPSPYNLASGKYAVNAEGFPTEKYVYQLPLSTTDEVFTDWTTCYTPQYIPEDGWGSIDVWAGLMDKTGVNIEYSVVSSDTRSENFSVLLAADTLLDIMDQGLYFYKGTPLEAVEEDYFVNLYDYKDYMPCYMYETYVRAQDNLDIMDRVFYNDTTIVNFLGMLVEPTPSMGLIVRQDWLDDLNLGKAIDITTYDKMEEVLTAFKTADSTRFPLWIYDTIEIGTYNYMFAGFDTFVWAKDLSFRRIVDGKVQFCGTTDDDKDAMTLLNSWFSKGFIDPNYAAHTTTYDSTPEFSSGQVGLTPATPSAITKMETTSTDTDCRWEPLKMVKKTEDQVLKYGLSLNNFNYGSTVISAKCENIPLVVSWVDWWYSDEGSDYCTWGVEGTTWTYNEKGERQLTEFITTHEAGASFALCIWAMSGLVNSGLFEHRRGYAVPGGDRFLAMFEVWTDPDYSGAYDWPAGVKLDDEQSEESQVLLTDLNTYYAENYISFLDGSKPMSAWADFQKGLADAGMDELVAIYQAAYDSYMSK